MTAFVGGAGCCGRTERVLVLNDSLARIKSGAGRCRVGSRSTVRASPTCSVAYGGLDHAGMIVEDTQKALRFYCDVLGMEDDTDKRPNLPFGGAFVRCGQSQIHLMQLPNMDPKTGRPQHGGRDKHVALTVENIDPLIESLERNGVTYTMSKSGRRALFCRDLDSNALEFIERCA